MRTIISAAFVGIFGLIASLPAIAADTAVSRVIVVQTADVPGYVHEVETLQALLKKVSQPATLRVWRASYAGADTGTIVVTVEVPSLAAIAKLEDTIRTNPDLSAEMKKISAMRKIVSDSIYELQSH
jgi:hypothetical protein